MKKLFRNFPFSCVNLTILMLLIFLGLVQKKLHLSYDDSGFGTAIFFLIFGPIFAWGYLTSLFTGFINEYLALFILDLILLSIRTSFLKNSLKKIHTKFSSKSSNNPSQKPLTQNPKE